VTCGLPDGLHTQLAHALVETLREKTVDDFLANLGRETAPHNRFRNFSRDESRESSRTFDIPRHSAESFRNVFGRNVEHQLAGAIGI